MSIFQIIELSSIILFVIYLLQAKRSFNLKFLFLALLYAFIFEDLSIVLFAGVEGGYFYNENFYLFIHKTPLFIVLLWSLILYSSHQIIRNIARQGRVIFLVPIYVLALDIVMDVVAVQMGLWTWIGFENYNGFFSVPASNYIGWLLTSFFFVLTWEKLKGKKILLLFQPVIAYILFILSILPLHFLKINFFDDILYLQYSVLFLLIVVFVFFAFFCAELVVSNAEPNYPLFVIRIFIHSFSLWGIIFLELYNNLLIICIFCLILFFEYTIFRKYSLLNK